jgi:sugar lactone lactonase YvrE
VTANGYTSNPPSGGGEGGSVAWADITGKPTTFTPAAHTQTASTISDSTTVGRAVLTAADAAAARTAVGAGTSSLALGATGSTAAAGNHSHTVTTVMMSWNGSAYVADSDALVYVGPNDPGAVPDGSIWIDTTP